MAKPPKRRRVTPTPLPTGDGAPPEVGKTLSESVEAPSEKSLSLKLEEGEPTFVLEKYSLSRVASGRFTAVLQSDGRLMVFEGKMLLRTLQLPVQPLQLQAIRLTGAGEPEVLVTAGGHWILVQSGCYSIPC